MLACENQIYYLRENVYGAESRSCSFRFEVGKEGLTFYFTVNDKDIISPFEKDNVDIWQADAVVVFLSADGKLTSYKEMEVSPYGIRFFADVTNEDGKTPQICKITPAFEAHVEWTSAGYCVRIFVSFTTLGSSDIKKMKFNAYWLDKKADRSQLLYALSPTFCESFHRPAYFIGMEAEK